jgi:phosphoenolpyruvate carboxykinase (GTP)
VPAEDELNTDGLELSPERVHELLEVDPAELREQLPQVKEHLARFGSRLPDQLQAQLEALEHRIGAA